MHDHEKELLAILEACAPALAEVPHETYESVSSLAKAGVGLEILCDQLYEYEILLPRALYERIDRLGKAMDIAPSRLDMLKELVPD